MGNRCTIFFKKTNVSSLTIKELIRGIQEHEYSKNAGEGFIINDFGEKEILGTYIYKSLTYFSKFDEERLTINREKIFVNNIINFSIDKKYNLLSIFSNTSSSRRLISEISKIFSFKLPIEDITFKLPNIIKQFKKGKLDIEITSIKIKNFQLTNNIGGTFWIKLLDNSALKTIINEYEGDPIFFGGKTVINGKDYQLGFYENGVLTITQTDFECYDIFDRMRDLLFWKEES